MLAGAYYWLPHITGRSSVHRLSVPAFWLIFIGFNLTFFLMHLTGLLGMPRRVFTYAAELGWSALNLLSSVGSFALTMGFALVFADFIVQFRFGRRSMRNPWKAATLEWATPTPPPSYAFASLPHIDKRADCLDIDEIGPELAAGRGYLGRVREERMETLGVSMTSGQLEHIVLLPRRTYLPLVSGVLTAGSVLSLLFKIYWLAAVFGIGIVASFIAWSQLNAVTQDLGAMDAGRGAQAPPHTEVDSSPAWWAAVFSLLANATLFASLVFGTFYLWLVAAAWPPPRVVEIGGLSVAALLGFAIYFPMGRLAIKGNADGRPTAMLYASMAVSLCQVALLTILLDRIPDPRLHAHLATSFALILYALVHAGLCFVLTLNTLLKAHRGGVSPQRRVDFAVNKLWYDYSAVTGILSIALILCMPYLIDILPAAS
jgi:cytochrome c oxidase subunit I+III